MTISGYTKHVIPCELKSGCQRCTCLSLLPLGDGEGLAVESCSSLLMSDLCVPPGRAEGKYFELAWNRCRYKVYTACQKNESRCHIHPFAYWEDEWYVWECICLHTWINSVSLTGSGSKQKQIMTLAANALTLIQIVCGTRMQGTFSQVQRKKIRTNNSTFCLLGLFWKVSTCSTLSPFGKNSFIVKPRLRWCNERLAGCVLLLTWY